MDHWVVVLENRWLLIYCNSQFNFLLSDTYFVVFVSAVWLIFSPWKRRVHLIIKNIFSWMRPLHLVTDLLEMRLNNYGFLLLKKQTTANRNTPKRHSRILLQRSTFCVFYCALRWAACWCWPGRTWIIAQKSSTTHQCCASSATSATRKSPPSFWSLGPV